MLQLLGEAGVNAGTAYDDAENGWFEWNFKNVPGMEQKDRGFLTIKFQPAEEDKAGETVTRRFWVIPA
jgi:hypothetical protein